MKWISLESARAGWSLKMGFFWKNNLSLSGWIVCLVLEIMFEIDGVSSADVG
jgi:hypothetical protein